MCELWSVDSYGLGSSHLFVGHIPRSLHMSLWLFVIQYPECCWWYTLTPQKSPCYCGVSHSSTATSCWCVEPQNHTDLTTVFFTQQITTIYKIMCICIHILHTLSTTINYIYYIYMVVDQKSFIRERPFFANKDVFFAKNFRELHVYLSRNLCYAIMISNVRETFAEKKNVTFGAPKKKNFCEGFQHNMHGFRN